MLWLSHYHHCMHMCVLQKTTPPLTSLSRPILAKSLGVSHQSLKARLSTVRVRPCVLPLYHCKCACVSLSVRHDCQSVRQCQS